jgi:hypothetical protein
VCLVRVARGIRPKLIAEYEREVQSATASQWSGALAGLDDLLAESQWQGAALRVVLADCWARYAIVPWAAHLTSSQERLGHARQLLASTYGDAVSGWDVRLSDGPPRCSRIACTLPAELLENVRGICSKHDARLAALQPQLVVAYENWRRHLPASGGWFVTVGAGTLAAARVALHSWDRVHNIRIGSDWVRDLRRLQTFGRLASASPEEGQVFVDAPQAWREVAGAAGRDLHWLEEDARSQSTLQRLGRLQRLAA